jgi:hypothetical protein
MLIVQGEEGSEVEEDEKSEFYCFENSNEKHFSGSLQRQSMSPPERLKSLESSVKQGPNSPPQEGTFGKGNFQTFNQSQSVKF